MADKDPRNAGGPQAGVCRNLLPAPGLAIIKIPCIKQFQLISFYSFRRQRRGKVENKTDKQCLCKSRVNGVLHGHFSVILLACLGLMECSLPLSLFLACLGLMEWVCISGIQETINHISGNRAGSVTPSREQKQRN